MPIISLITFAVLSSSIVQRCGAPGQDTMLEKLLIGPPSSELRLNISSLLKHTTRVTVVKNESMACDAFETELIKYLARPVLVITGVETAEKCPDCSDDGDEDEGVPELGEEMRGKQIFFVLFESLESLLDRTGDELALRNADRSHYFLVVLSRAVENFECGSAEAMLRLRRLFGEFLHELWSDLRLLEITIILPHLCREQITLKYDPVGGRDVADRSEAVRLISEPEDSESIEHRYRNFHNYPLVVNYFERIPTFVKSMPPNSLEAYSKGMRKLPTLGGLDGYALGTVVDALNFTPVLKVSADGKEYGYRQPDGSFSGSMGDLIAKRMDISMSARFLKNYGSDEVEFLRPVYYDEFCVLAPKALAIPAWMSIFLVFDVQVWLVIGLTFLCASAVWWLLKTKFPSQKGRGMKRESTAQCFHFLDIWLLLVSSPLLVLPTITRERLLVMSCLIFNLIFAGLFQGYLSTAYSTTAYYADISTLAQLDESELPISTKNLDIFGLNLTRTGQSLTKKIIKDKKDAVAEAAEYRAMSVVERRTDADLVISLNYTRKDGQPKLHIVNECPRSYHLAYIVYKGYPFLHFIDDFFQRTVEAGLNNKWYRDTKFSLLLKHRQTLESRILTRKLDMIDVQTSFWLLSYSLGVSVVVFVLEIIVHRIGKCREEMIEAARTDIVYTYEISVR